MSSFMSHLEWRRAIKAFDSSREISSADLEKVLHALRMAPTSFGLQPFEVEVVKSKTLREKLLPHAWNQAQVTNSSVLLVFVARNDLKHRISEYFEHLSGGKSDARAKLKDYEGMMRGALESRSPEELFNWSAKQAYIALGFAMAACAELEIDSCPMEGFVSAEFDKILGLGAHKRSVVILPLGYRDKTVPLMPQFRFSEADLIKKNKN